MADLRVESEELAAGMDSSWNHVLAIVTGEVVC
jgi:hypothetical protein